MDLFNSFFWKAEGEKEVAFLKNALKLAGSLKPNSNPISLAESSEK